MLPATYLVKNTAIIGFMGGLSALSGLALDATILATVGLGPKTDAFFVSYGLPLLVIGVIQLQTSKVLVPILRTALENDGKEGFSRLLGSLLTAAVMIFAAFGIITAFLSSFLIKVQAPGLDRSTASLAVHLAVFLSFLPLLKSVTLVLAASLNSIGRFAAPSSLKLCENGVKLIVVLALSRHLGIFSLVCGLFAGGLIELVVMLTATWRSGHTITLNLHLRDARVIRAAKLAVMPIASNTVAQMTLLLQNYLTSFLMPGSISAFRYATRLVECLSSVSSGGVVTVLLSMTSANMAKRNPELMKENIRMSLRLLAAVTIPLSAYLLVMSPPVISVVFARLNLTAAHAILVGQLLQALVPYIFLSRFLGIGEVAFLAASDTTTPSVVSLYTLAINVGASLLLFPHLQVFAFPAAILISYSAGSFMLFRILGRRAGCLGFSGLLVPLSKLMGCSIAAAAVLMLLLETDLISSLAPLPRLVIPSVFAGVLFLGAAFLWGMLQPRQLYAWLVRTSQSA